MTDHADEGGDSACWAHLFDDAYGGVDLAHPFAGVSPVAEGQDERGRHGCSASGSGAAGDREGGGETGEGQRGAR